MEERKAEEKEMWQTPHTLYLDMFTSDSVDVRSRSNCGKNEAASGVRTPGHWAKEFSRHSWRLAKLQL